MNPALSNNPSLCSTQNQLFNDADADVILRSSDNVDFRAHKCLLSFASSMFHGMFTLPLPNDPVPSEIKDGIPLISMTEDSRTTEKLLMFCHPSYAPTLDSLDDIKSVLVAATKYEMAGIRKRASRYLSHFITSEPLRIYCIACKFGLEEEAKLAAKQLLASPMFPRHYIKELDYVPATALHRLEEYHYNCQKAAKEVTCRGKSGEGEGIDPKNPFRFKATCSTCPSSNRALVISRNGSQWISWSSWWREYMKDVAVALQERPCGATVKNSDLLNRTFQRAAACSICQGSVFTKMTEFCEVFAQEVDKATDLVVLEFGEV
ncbi:hypothetical protein K435DRAFT_717008 [Dendrothele bispora CBS 962.96]|uniref:BTB domain-containing protein n=1 Tax=Dendrothele bispora (strain CBS 962.96) TaxID=1314807 RepID=A0A4S8MIG9_DENBC|nr:hypothetical protein K435DRAFT_717008 [Dendrothele bispora CBS 962.96]